MVTAVRPLLVRRGCHIDPTACQRDHTIDIIIDNKLARIRPNLFSFLQQLILASGRYATSDAAMLSLWEGEGGENRTHFDGVQRIMVFAGGGGGGGSNTVEGGGTGGTVGNSTNESSPATDSFCIWDNDNVDGSLYHFILAATISLVRFIYIVEIENVSLPA